MLSFGVFSLRLPGTSWRRGRHFRSQSRNLPTKPKQFGVLSSQSINLVRVRLAFLPLNVLLLCFDGECSLLAQRRDLAPQVDVGLPLEEGGSSQPSDEKRSSNAHF
jgi:hypothetical protein